MTAGLDMVFVIIDIVKIKIESQAKLGSLPNLLPVEMHAMSTWRKVAYALKSKVIVKPQSAKGVSLEMQAKE